MKSITAELATLQGSLPDYPDRPQLTGLAEEISVFVGRRSDQLERAVHPSTVFEMELDAEVQEISRQYVALQAEVDEYLTQHSKTAATRAKVLYAAFGLLVVLCIGVTWLAQPKTAPAAAPQVPPGSGIPAVLSPLEPASASRPPVATASAPDAALAPTSAPNPPLPAASSKSPALDQPGGRPAPTAPPVAAGPLDTGTLAKGAPVTTGKGIEKEAKIFALEDAAPSKPEPATPSATPPHLPAQPKKVVDPVVVKSDPVSKPPTKAAPIAESGSKSSKSGKARSDAADGVEAVEPDATKAVTSEEGAKTARKDRYGSSGVVTLMPSGVVVFDVATKSQKMVNIGGKLPDGSVLKGVDAKAGRIKTDKGEVEYE